MNVMVQKFGGTSVESKEKMKLVCDIVKNYKEQGYELVVVVSAMGRKGAPYATDTLINLCKEVNENSSSRDLDFIMSCGEVISGAIFTSVLKKEGIEAVLLNAGQAGIITDGKYGNATVVSVKPDRIVRELNKGNVVVVTGFQGVSENGDITTLGRGGSDTSAVILGKSLDTKVVEIYTDVNGIMTADPKIEPNAKTIKNLNYDEVFQMAEKGAKVIHPRAVEVAKSHNITLKIKNALSPDEGTNICACSYNKIESYRCASHLMTAIAHENDISQVIIKNCREQLFTQILNDIHSKDISIDMINFFINEKAFTIKSEKIEMLKEVLNNYKAEYYIENECSKVTLIGSKITGIPGVMAKIVSTLCDANVNILQTSDSHMTISCLVKTIDIQRAVNMLHKAFNLCDE